MATDAAQASIITWIICCALYVAATILLKRKRDIALFLRDPQNPVPPTTVTDVNKPAADAEIEAQPQSEKQKKNNASTNGKHIISFADKLTRCDTDIVEVPSRTGIVIGAQKETPRTIIHYIVVATCFVAPSLIMGSYIAALNINHLLLSENTISMAIGYTNAKVPVVVCTVIGAIMTAFLMICRQIQVHEIFRSFGQKNPDILSKVKRYTKINTSALAANVLAHISLIFMASFDWINYPSMHLLFAGTGFFGICIFNVLHSITTTKIRKWEWKDKSISLSYADCGPLFWIDALHYYVCTAIAILSLTIYGILYAHFAANGYQNWPKTANIVEWIAMAAIAVYTYMLAFTFTQNAADSDVFSFYEEYVKTIIHCECLKRKKVDENKMEEEQVEYNNNTGIEEPKRQKQ